MTDYLAEAKNCAGSVEVNIATMYALVSIAESLRRLADQRAPEEGCQSSPCCGIPEGCE